MANFKTHLGVGAATSGLLATACLGAGIAEPAEMAGLAVAGTIGALLPDVDSDYSSPMKAMFTALGLIAAALMVFSVSQTAPILELWIIAAVSYCAVRYAICSAFRTFTVHRGIFHSLAAAALFWLLAAAAGDRWFGLGPRMAWATGFFLFAGYVVHLVLDELFSVDLMNSRIKRSFGTALKVVDYRNWRTSAALVAVVIAAFALAPDPQPFFDVIRDRATYERIAERFLRSDENTSRKSPPSWARSRR